MYNVIRKMVSGQRNRFTDEEYNLDLTYITPRIIAMSFPAGKFIQKIYRNNIEDVGSFMAKHHPDAYHVYNCSGIEYDATAFDNRMTTYDWEDHHSPSLVLLFEAC